MERPCAYKNLEAVAAQGSNNLSALTDGIVVTSCMRVPLAVDDLPELFVVRFIDEADMLSGCMSLSNEIRRACRTKACSGSGSSAQEDTQLPFRYIPQLLCVRMKQLVHRGTVSRPYHGCLWST